LLAAAWAMASGQNTLAPIHFVYRPIDFRLESCETPQRHAPETMAGGVAIFDYNNDGYLDIFFTNGADIRTLKKTSPKYSNRLFENDGKGNFKDVTAKAGLAGVGFDNGVAIGDYDNDGYKDIFVTRGHVQSLEYASRVRVEQPNTVFRGIPGNPGGVRFEALTAEAGLTAQPPSRHRGSAVGDLNGDGRLDVAASAIGAPAEVWLNDSPGGGHWLAFELQGTTSNRDGIGAGIKVTAGGAVQYNHVSFAAGYASSSAGPTHFGLGASKSADLVGIRWPSGITQELRNLAADRVVKLQEPPK